MKNIVVFIVKLVSKQPKLYLIAWALLIVLLCSFPGQHIPSINLLELLGFDKWVHLSVFFILMFLCINLIESKKINTKYIYLFTVLCVFFGGILEILQALIFSHRSADYLDFIANSLGCVLALIVYEFKMKKKLRDWEIYKT